jgi:ABC-type transport system involved in multi-copper enzyme maturation permease subunit
MSATLTAPAAAATAASPGPAPGPAQGISFARLVRVEWGKATDTRSARWLMAIVVLAMAAIMLVPLLDPGGTEQTYSNYLSFPALAVTTLLPVVAILTLTTEWTQRTVLATFTQEPRRGRVLTAKVAVSMLLSLAGTVLSGVLTVFAVLIAAAAGRHVTADLSTAQVIGAVLFVALVMLKGVALGALLANTAAAIVLFFVLPTAFAIVGSALASVGPWLDTTTTFIWVSDGAWSGHVARIVVSTVVWVVVPLAVGVVATLRREVT